MNRPVYGTCPRCSTPADAAEAQFALVRCELGIAATSYARALRGSGDLSEFAQEMIVARAERELELRALEYAGAVQVRNLAELEAAATARTRVGHLIAGPLPPMTLCLGCHFMHAQADERCPRCGVASPPVKP